MSGDSATVRRGRPPQTRAQADEVRARIVDATAAVFARNGSRGLSVAQIIEQAGLARPTFYRYFGNASEPLHVVLTASNDGLVGGIREALSGTDEPVQLGIRLIDAYVDWARGHGPMLRPLFAELHDPGSPVSAYRERALDDIRDLVRKTFEELGRPVPAPLDMDAALHVCEYIVYRLTADAEPGSDPDPALASEARITMIRVLLVTLGTRDDLAYAMELPGLFPDA
ncbi:TetR/AcrR family transcriptional regulator [Nocardia asteroides]|uniref:Transcriptional regulator n=1 Tax=Nocardia asteroides NBRC 15531 TaxID=1110697 RepID=U5EGW7_NOCAS|nr:TetR/AcrR family transcriptional regulator [Nocardia asteroides]TLF67570.1 TetR/AcrR family transcriptional regulator [Nocardia asteroides NBRC 15531]UGT50929.1 TetR/AcrR family transcriptional regulator [Nocardia asteroides]SFN44806.1 transcriptional regulator, TetR family [Nocardia asteroides]VEG36216.1 DNA-binding transcriptional repressor AcrR [Nocardia asteroides]GAD85621.1 putative transcriptional regulator [Nocardia asteroides NBRC 15531]